MKEPFQDITGPFTGAVPETLDQICDACGNLSLNALLKSPSISLRNNYSGMDEEEWMK